MNCGGRDREVGAGMEGYLMGAVCSKLVKRFFCGICLCFLTTNDA